MFSCYSSLIPYVCVASVPCGLPPLLLQSILQNIVKDVARQSILQDTVRDTEMYTVTYWYNHYITTMCAEVHHLSVDRLDT